MPSAAPPTLLAIDTATEVCSVALARGAHVVQRTQVVGHAHSTILLPWIETLLGEQQVQLSECDAIAFGAGPGAFTGLRIACAVAQGLAWGANKPVLPVGNLAALAWAAARGAAQTQRVATVMDARMHEAYWAVFDVQGDTVHEVVAPSLSAARVLLDELRPHAPQVVAGNALSAFDLNWDTLAAQLMPQLRADAAAIAVLAQQAWAQGQRLAPAQARPLYVRDRVAQTIEERQRS